MPTKITSLSAREALKLVVDKLTHNDGYYKWTALGDPSVWLLRVPREDKGDTTWSKKETIDMIHLCQPLKFVEAMERNDRKDLSTVSGYVVNGECVRCKKTIPEDVERRLQVQVKLNNLRKKVAAE